MKYLNTYRKLELKNEPHIIFNFLINTLNPSIATWSYFVDFDKVIKNINYIEKELYLLNSLIGKKNIEYEFLSLIKDYPKIRRILPILIAIRNKKINNLNIIAKEKMLNPKIIKNMFNPKIKIDSDLEYYLLLFFNQSGLKEIFTNKNIKNIVDYCFGVEVGLDTNARKNRSGTLMENIVEEYLHNLRYNKSIDFIKQPTKQKISSLWDINIELDKSNRRFDFAIRNTSNDTLAIIETNYYSGGGSKLKATAGEYQYLHDLLSNQNINLIWITDGYGWHSSKKPLEETFIHNDYVFNLHLVNKGALIEVLQ